MARIEIKRSVDFSNPKEKREFIAEADTLQGRYRVNIEPERDSLSNQQRAWYFSCIVKAFRDYLQEQECESVTLDMAHQLLKSKMLTVSVFNHKTGEIIGERVQSITELDRVRMADFCERCRVWLNSFFGIVVPDPDPNWQFSK